jgi:lipid-A-disaccharide synthase
MSRLSYVLGRLLVRIPNIGLVNIVAGKQIVPELVQGRANPKAVRDAVLPLILDQALRESVQRDLAAVSGRLGEFGASGRAASLALETFGLLPESP